MSNARLHCYFKTDPDRLTCAGAWLELPTPNGIQGFTVVIFVTGRPFELRVQNPTFFVDINSNHRRSATRKGMFS